MSPEYPAFRCLFCHKLFASRKAVDDHFDHFIPEYCRAYKVKLRQHGRAYHPLAILRYIRSDTNRNRAIEWELDPAVVPMEGVSWNFAIPVPDRAARDAALREGYHTASWWIDRLCQRRVATPPPASLPPPAPAAARVAGHQAGAVTGHFSRSVRGPVQAAVNLTGDINANIIDAQRQDHFEDESDTSTPARRARHRSRRVPAPLTPVHRSTPRRVRFTPSPFMGPTAPLVATVLHVRFFGHVYPVAITRRMDIHGAMAALKEVVPGEWDDGTWAMFGMAAEEAGVAWEDGEWRGLKRRWIEKTRGQGEGERAWVVMKRA